MSECHLRKTSPLSILTASGPRAGGTASPIQKPGLRAQYLPRPSTWREGRSQGELCGVHRQAFGRIAEPRRAGTVVLARTQGSGGQQKTNMSVTWS